MKMEDYCFECECVTPSRAVQMVGGVQYLCEKCGAVVDTDYEDDCYPEVGTHDWEAEDEL